MTVTTAERGAARVVSWDRQERRNAWDLETMTAIADAVEEVGSDEQVRCVVLRGAGEHFSAGDDLQSAIEADGLPACGRTPEIDLHRRPGLIARVTRGDSYRDVVAALQQARRRRRARCRDDHIAARGCMGVRAVVES